MTDDRDAELAELRLTVSILSRHERDADRVIAELRQRLDACRCGRVWLGSTRTVAA